MSSGFVLDASAILALLQREPGSQRVEAVLPDAFVSAVNVSEVAAKLIDAGVPEASARLSIDSLGIEVIGFDTEMAYIASHLRPVTRHLGLSLGDRCCLALGSIRQIGRAHV